MNTSEQHDYHSIRESLVALYYHSIVYYFQRMSNVQYVVTAEPIRIVV